MPNISVLLHLFLVTASSSIWAFYCDGKIGLSRGFLVTSVGES